MGVLYGPPMAGDMFDDGKDTTFEQSLAGGAPKGSGDLWVGMERAVADNVMGAGHGNIEYRQAIHVESQFSQVMGNKTGIDTHGLAGGVHVTAGQFAENSRCGVVRPMGRSQTCDPSAFLVEQNEHIFAPSGCTPNCCTKLCDQGANLIGRLAVAGEKNKTGRGTLGEKTDLFVAQL